jgi:hypothetical protein
VEMAIVREGLKGILPMEHHWGQQHLQIKPWNNFIENGNASCKGGFKWDITHGISLRPKTPTNQSTWGVRMESKDHYNLYNVKDGQMMHVKFFKQ